MDPTGKQSNALRPFHTAEQDHLHHGCEKEGEKVEGWDEDMFYFYLLLQLSLLFLTN